MHNHALFLSHASSHMQTQSHSQLQAMTWCRTVQLKKKKNHYIFSSQLRADSEGLDQMPGPPWEGQLMWKLFLNTHQ